MATPKANKGIYDDAIRAVFFKGFKEGINRFSFNRGDLIGTMKARGLPIAGSHEDIAKNVGDIVYTFRFRKDFPKEILATAGDQVEVTFPLELPFLRLRTVDGLPSMIAAFTTDIPKLTKWGEPLLIGPGSIHVAHTEGEYIPKSQLHEAIELYCQIARQLVAKSKHINR